MMKQITTIINSKVSNKKHDSPNFKEFNGSQLNKSFNGYYYWKDFQNAEKKLNYKERR